MIIGAHGKIHRIKIDKDIIEQINKFKYLGTTINEGDEIIGEANEKIGKMERVYSPMKTLFLNEKEVSKEVRAEVMKLVMTYGSQLLTPSKIERSRLISTEMR